LVDQAPDETVLGKGIPGDCGLTDSEGFCSLPTGATFLKLLDKTAPETGEYMVNFVPKDGKFFMVGALGDLIAFPEFALVKPAYLPSVEYLAPEWKRLTGRDVKNLEVREVQFEGY